MKFLLIILSFTFVTCVNGQNAITGTWFGNLEIQGTQLPLVLHVSNNSGTFTSSIDSPSQKAFGMIADETHFDSNMLHFKIKNINASFYGNVSSNEIVGEFTQNGNKLPLTFYREKKEVLIQKKPQEPTLPIPYFVQDVSFVNKKAGIILKGTLTKPSKKGNFPVVVLVSGSGPQNRDEELLGHKPFLVLADYLTRNGIAVLRYDDRGVGESGGVFSIGTTLDFADDASSAVDYLKSRKDFKKSKIGVIGHSEGGLIAPIVATSNPKVNFVILLAGTGVNGAEIIELQSVLIAKSTNPNMTQLEIDQSNELIRGMTKIINDNKLDPAKCQPEMRLFFNRVLKDSISVIEKETGKPFDEAIEDYVQQFSSPWMMTFLTLEPKDYLSKLKVPTLALNGSKDLQVDPKQNLVEIERLVKSNGNSSITAIVLPQMNHLFQTCTKCTIEEYSELEETFSPLAMSEIKLWLREQLIIK